MLGHYPGNWYNRQMAPCVNEISHQSRCCGPIVTWQGVQSILARTLLAYSCRYFLNVLVSIILVLVKHTWLSPGLYYKYNNVTGGQADAVVAPQTNTTAKSGITLT